MKIIGHHVDRDAFLALELHLHAHHVSCVHEGGGCWFVVFARDPTLREQLERAAGVTLLPTAHSPRSIATPHHAMLAAHGVNPGDSHWDAHEKLASSLGHPLFHPDV